MSGPGPYRLVVLRHGQSEWNAAGLFTGWENAHLTAQGEEEATRAGSLLAEHGVFPVFERVDLLRSALAYGHWFLLERQPAPPARPWRKRTRPGPLLRFLPRRAR